jgi:glutamate-1-semialdehyde 2,1-aminomutase
MKMPNEALEQQQSIGQIYRARTAGSAALAAQARTLFPSGVTHDSRYLEPYGVYVERANGAYKWDVDGHRYIDYFGGHGSLLLGHNFPAVTKAVHEALDRGTHFAANHEREIEWARAIVQLIPCAERVRFTASGTEATMMALRLARAITGRSKVVRFKGHFHGWHDDVTTGYRSHYDGTPTVGVRADVAQGSVLLESGDGDVVGEVLANDPDIAAVIVEPLGASTGAVPLHPDFLRSLRQHCTEHDVVLIFDEVITGFRVAPGGAQAAFGVMPDLTALAKIVAGGLPGAAVVGRRELFDVLDYLAAQKSGREKIYHPGTYNANPISAAAGVAALTQIAQHDFCQHATRMAERLRQLLNQALLDENVPWAVYGTSSAFHMFMNAEGVALDPTRFDPFAYTREQLLAKPPKLLHDLRLAMLTQGVDLSGWPGGLVSGVHQDEDVEATASAFRQSLRMMRCEGSL